MKLTLKGKANTYASLRKLISGLKEVADGKAFARASIRFTALIRGRIKGELARHVRTGKALYYARVNLSTKAVEIVLQRYYRFIPWSWKKGTPRSVLNQGKKIFAEEMAKSVGGKS